MTRSDTLTPWFGFSLIPAAENSAALLEQARRADAAGLDFVSVQDHPYNPNFLDAWTLLAVVGAQTQRVRLLPNVANLPLRPPAMLAKAAASLDRLTGGRVELGLGAGYFWQGIAAYGGPERTPSEAVSALEEAIHVLRALWQPGQADQTLSFAGEFYQVKGAQPGPAPAHRIGTWLGAYQRRMLRLTGRLADGWIPSSSYLPPERVLESQAVIDQAAEAAGRPPTAVRRAYNLAGQILPEGRASVRAARPGVLIGPQQRWVDELTRYILDLRLDAFSFYPIGDDTSRQLSMFAEQVVPAVREAVGARAEL